MQLQEEQPQKLRKLHAIHHYGRFCHSIVVHASKEMQLQEEGQ
jgi:hypothetical protein